MTAPPAPDEPRAGRRRNAALAAGLALLVVVLAWPALTGSFIYDDVALASHPYLDGQDDLVAAWGRNSADYLDTADIAVRSTATWRPLSMISIIAVQAVAGPSPTAHHLVSLGLHGLAVALVVATLRRRDAAPVWQALGGALVALHPAPGEAWLWINGRSDVLAGVWLAGLAYHLAGASTGARRAVVSTLLMVGGALSKETFLPAALGLCVAHAQASVPERSARHLVRDVAGACLPFVGAAAVFWFGRVATLPEDLPVLGGGGLPGPLRLLTRGPDLVGLGLETLLVPQARGMRFLGWELSGRGALPGLLATACVVLAVALLLRRGRHRAAALLTGATLTLLPVGLVGDAFWLGFDRYLYLPLVLIVLALAEAPAPAPRLALAGGGPALLVCAWALWGTAGTYASPVEFALGMATLRPGEPTGALMTAGEAVAAGRREAALALLDARPVVTDRPVPPALTHQLAGEYLGLGRPDRAAALIEEAAAAAPDDPNLRFDLMTLRMGQRRVDEALALAEALIADPLRRPATRAQLAQWAADARLPGAVRERCRGLAGP
ncbi:hypothetical protein L6V77_29605 [Myxococcota bacterium]|nr:hypothetical protein [Myxococcota bacterium]